MTHRKGKSDCTAYAKVRRNRVKDLNDGVVRGVAPSCRGRPRTSPTMETQTRHFTVHSRVVPEAYMDVQRVSFQRFLNTGLMELFRPYRDIRIDDGDPASRGRRLTFHDRHYRLAQPALTVKECLLRRESYVTSLYMPIEFSTPDHDDGVIAWFKVMNLPLMTTSGHFIIRGIARAILNQTVRSPGVHFQYTPGTSDHGTYHADFIAQRGSWLRLEAYEKGRGVWARLKYTPRLPLGPFLRCFGLPPGVVNNTLVTGVESDPACPDRLNPGLRRGLRIHYDPPRVGSRLVRDRPRYSAGRSAADVGTAAYVSRSWRNLNYAVRGFADPDDAFAVYRFENRADRGSRVDVEAVYRRFLRRRFWNPRAYTLGSGGRWRLNQTLGLRLPPEQTALTACDVLFAAHRLVRCAAYDHPLNDVDDLQNQMVKTGPNLLQQVIATGLDEFARDLRIGLTGPDGVVRERAGRFQTAMVFPGPRPPHPSERLFDPANLSALRAPSAPGRVAPPVVGGLPTARRKRVTDDALHRRSRSSVVRELAQTFLIKTVDQGLKTFFGTNPLSQFLDETNALAELTHKRRLSSLGLGGITRETAPMAARSIHPTHYGRVCPIETPEGKNAGLVKSPTSYGGIDGHGLIGTPLSQTYRGYIRWDKPPRHVNSAQESRVHVACGDRLRSRYQFLDPAGGPTRYGNDVARVPRDSVEWVAPVTSQMTSVATGLIPFLEHDDGNRALMGSNMQRQAVPTYGASRPIVATGGEPRAVANAAANVQARAAGMVGYVDGHRVTVLRPRSTPSLPDVGRPPHRTLSRTRDVRFCHDVTAHRVRCGVSRTQWLPSGHDASRTQKASVRTWDVTQHQLTPLNRSNQDTPRMDRPTVHPGQWVQRGGLVAENTSSHRGDLAVGQNLIVGYSPWEGYNFEDALLINRRLAKDDLLTSLHVSRYEIELRDTPCGHEWITRDGLPEAHRHPSWDQLDDDGIVRVGSWVRPGDTLVGRLTPLKPDALTPYHDLLFAALRRKRPDTRDTSLVLPLHGTGRVVHVERVPSRFDPAIANIPITERMPGVKAGRIRRQEGILTEMGRFRDERGLTQQDRERSQRWVDRRRRSAIGVGPIRTDIVTNDVVSGGSTRGPATGVDPRVHGSTVRRLSGPQRVTAAYATRHDPTVKTEAASRQKRSSLRRVLWSVARPTRAGSRGRRFVWSPYGLRGRTALRPYGSGRGDVTAYAKVIDALRSRRQRTPEATPDHRRDAAIDVSRHRRWSYGASTGHLTAESYPSLRVQPPPVDYPGRSKFRLLTRVVVYVAHEKRIQVGDKLSGRHGNKGIISRLLPRADMPYLPDGTPLDVVLNPLGVPSRMNVGQIFECLLGLAGAYLHQNYRLVPFDEIYGCEASRSLVYAKLYEARLKSRQDWLFDPNFPGKVRLFDGRTGQCFRQPVTVGKAYILKLIHLVDEKIHSRTVGPYSLITQQPLRGRSKRGGQRLGEMEVWALEGFGASYALQEMMTYKSDDMSGRRQLVRGFQTNRRTRWLRNARESRRDGPTRPPRPRSSKSRSVPPTMGGSRPHRGFGTVAPEAWLLSSATGAPENRAVPLSGAATGVDTGRTGDRKPDPKPKWRPEKPSHHMPESFRVLMYEIQGLGLRMLTGYNPSPGRSRRPISVSSDRVPRGSAPSRAVCDDL